MLETEENSKCYCRPGKRPRILIEGGEGLQGIWVNYFVVSAVSLSHPFSQKNSWQLSGRISPAWEEESPGRNPKSLKKVSKKSSDPRAPKSLGEGPKSLKKTVFGLFRDFSDPPRDFFQTFGARGSEDFFERLFSDFWGFGRETPPPRPGRS